ncbi:MAG: 2-amino-4-hydroxy-6-hydroxymethyldihydropteridine diphosphokinase [Methylophilaceae bacterium]
MHKAYVALGSNLSNPDLQVQKAFLALEKLPKTKVTQQSSLYQTAPVGYDKQPDFINAVAEICTHLKPEKLLKSLLAVEQDFGRARPFANAPRILDLDLLCYEDTDGYIVQKTNFLILPHPHMHLRGFVLLPLAEIAPNLVLAEHGNVVKLAEPFQNQDIVKLGNRNQA